jgi:hypothetical protein
MGLRCCKSCAKRQRREQGGDRTASAIFDEMGLTGAARHTGLDEPCNCKFVAAGETEVFQIMPMIMSFLSQEDRRCRIARRNGKPGVSRLVADSRMCLDSIPDVAPEKYSACYDA